MRLAGFCSIAAFASSHAIEPSATPAKTSNTQCCFTNSVLRHTSISITVLNAAYHLGTELLLIVLTQHRNDTKQCMLGKRLSGSSSVHIMVYMNLHTPSASITGLCIVVGQHMNTMKPAA